MNFYKGKEDMVHEMTRSEKNHIKQKKEFFTRLLSSFLFIPFIFLLFFVPYKLFAILCWATYVMIVCEIFSPKIKGKLPLRVLALLICFVGIYSFMYCREFFGPFGCGFLICIASFTDIGAYSFGTLLKGPKLCPKISPNKTWAGFGGGIIMANIAFLCLSNVFPKSSMGGSFLITNVKNFWVVQTIILSSIGGDLLESAFKREIAVKDMGNLFPGHGGVLDRLDSLILSSIVLVVLDVLF
ncbi:MAG: phosphatidate cytidylyltransferase [Holosporaceae bacterium]|jgi:phosphatidate cytidylyltransferase|nr:phosphatidate cytidylyltransferase [Holosporaceae bacterium]